jgi:DNA-directed RNA polymerase subunit RPC12/RpoP
MMGILGKILKKPEPETVSAPSCSHRVLTARWDRIEDMGRDELVTGYRCETCGELFSAEAGRELMSMV